MSLYKKKPVEVEAVRWLGTAESFSLILTTFPSLPWAPGPMGKKAFYLNINTNSEGTLQIVSCGDYIVKAPNGDFEVYAANVFHETHELVKELPNEQSDETKGS